MSALSRRRALTLAAAVPVAAALPVMAAPAQPFEGGRLAVAAWVEWLADGPKAPTLSMEIDVDLSLFNEARDELLSFEISDEARLRVADFLSHDDGVIALGEDSHTTFLAGKLTIFAEPGQRLLRLLAALRAGDRDLNFAGVRHE